MRKPTAIIISLTASLLFWTTQVSGESFTVQGKYDSSEQYLAQSFGSNISIGHSSGLLQQIRTRMSNLGLNMPGRPGEASQYGEAPAWDAAAPPVAQQAVPPTLAVPVSEGPQPNEQLPNGFMGGEVTPNQYQQPAPPNVAGPYLPSYRHPQGYAPPPPGHPVQSFIPEQRIVYVPYAAPPPIYVERLGKALPRPPVVRRVLGDANIYEYPEMPMRTYTARGPRDFLAPNPPSIGY